MTRDDLLTALRVRYDIPDAFFRCDATGLKSLLDGPTLFYLEGMRQPPLFITILQHGNEPTGFDALQQLLHRYRDGKLPRTVWLFVGNVAAAAQGRRVLEDQLDYNRAWPGTEHPTGSETILMRAVVETVTAKPLFASIDLHNNTGRNPHYACINSLDGSFQRLATLFSRTVVYFQQPKGVQSMAMAQHCPAVTLECGKAGEDAALDHAVEFVDACLHMHHLPQTSVPAGDIHLLQTKAIVRVRSGLEFRFGEELGSCDVVFRPDLETFNFGRLAGGETVGRVRQGGAQPLKVTEETGADITDALLTLSGDKIITRQSLIPSMATRDIDVVRQDCLFYVMEEMQDHAMGSATLP